MNSNKSKLTAAIAIIVVLIIGSVTIVRWKHTDAPAREQARQAARITAAAEQIQNVNAGLPDLQVQAKTLIFTAMIQKKIPAASKWCETLNVDHKLWKTTPTNTLFALNSAVAGRAFSKTNRMAGDLVVFFETSNPGWNQAGGAELLATHPAMITVALADGRALTVSPAEAAKLRWTP